MKCRVVKARRGSCRDVYLFFRCEDGKKYRYIDRNFVPYFYIPSNFGLYKSIFGEPVQRIEAPCPENVAELRAQYPKHYEADIPYARRYLIDMQITDYVEFDGSTVRPVDSGHISLRIFYLDIEVYVESGIFPDPVKAEHPVIAISFYDTYTEKYYTLAYIDGVERSVEGFTTIKANGKEYKVPWRIEIYPDEERLLLAFSAYWDSFYPDVVGGWNIGFDVEYLQNRGKRYNIHYSTDGVIVFDLMEAYKILGPRQRSYALKEVTVSEGLESREEALHSQEVLSKYTEEPKVVLQYSLRDVWRIVEIDKKRRLIDYYMSIKALAGLEDITRKRGVGRYTLYSNLPIVDTVILRTAKEFGVVLPSSIERSKVPYRGAEVLEPVGGIWRDVAVFDMSRYYPSLIMSFNISPETKLEIVDPVNRIWKFREEPVGLIPRAVRKLLDYREQLEAELQKYRPGTPEYQDVENKIMAVKGVTNSFYGVMANEFFRLFDVDIAASITGLAREGIIHVVETAKKMGYKPLYGDSVAKDTEVIIRINGEVRFVKIADLFKRVDIVSEDGKEYYVPREKIEILTAVANGKVVWRPIKYVMRHKTEKKMYRVWITNRWYIDVTEDHSLVVYLNKRKAYNKPFWKRLRLARPTELGKYSTTLLTFRKELVEDDYMVNEKFWELVGLLLGDGSWGGDSKNSRYYVYLSAGQDYEEIVEKVLEPLRRQGIIKRYYLKKKGDIQINSPVFARFMKLFKKESGQKYIPEWVYRLPTRAIASLLRGLFTSDGTVSGRGLVAFINVNDELIDGTRRLLWILGISNSVYRENRVNDYNGRVSGTHTKRILVKDIERFAEKVGFILDRKQNRVLEAIRHRRGVAKSSIKHLDLDFVWARRIEEIDYNDYVYDVEVEDTHVFFANGVLVHNTDSVFIQVPFEKAGELAEELTEDLREYFKEKYSLTRKPALKLKFEKYYERIFFKPQTKKRYAGLLVWKKGKEVVPPQLDIVGFEAVRTDVAPITTEVQAEIFRLILSGAGEREIHEYLQKISREVKERPLTEVALVEGLSKELEHYRVRSPHVRAAIYSNLYLGTRYGKGMKVRYVYVKRVKCRGMAPTDVVAFEPEMEEKIRECFEIDWNKQFEVVIYAPLREILSSVGINITQSPVRRWW